MSASVTTHAELHPGWLRLRVRSLRSFGARFMTRRDGVFGVLILAVFTVLAIAPQLFVGPLETAVTASGGRLAAPDAAHLLGTDALGRDVFSRLVYGARVSLLAGLGGAVLALALAVALGGVAGQRSGGMVDAVVMGASELFLALPWLYLLLAARAFLPLDLSPTRAFLVIVSILGLVGWAGPARLVRASVAAASQRDFVVAARAAGASRARVLRRHLLPPSLGVVRTQAALLVPQFVLAEVALSFVGLGVSEPVPSWGNMLAALQQYHVVSRAWWMFAPGVALVLVGWCYHAWAVDAETRGRRVAS